MQIVFSDPHINEDSLEELASIFNEILTYKSDRVFILGDLFEKRHPTPLELEFGTKWMHKFKKEYKNVYLLTGNHEEIDKKCSSISYLKYLGINVLSEEAVIDNMLLGHFFVDKSNKSFGKYKYKIADLESKKYDWILLGHQHNFQKLGERVYHIGSIRHITYNELHDKFKQITIINDDNNITFEKLKSVIPMREVFTIADLETLNKITKVQLTYKNFEQFKSEVNNIEKYKDKFVKLKVKLDFDTPMIKQKNYSKKADISNLKVIVQEWLNKIEDKDVKKELQEVFN